jgi:hypothetical protein
MNVQADRARDGHILHKEEHHDPFTINIKTCTAVQAAKLYEMQRQWVQMGKSGPRCWAHPTPNDYKLPKDCIVFKGIHWRSAKTTGSDCFMTPNGIVAYSFEQLQRYLSKKRYRDVMKEESETDTESDDEVRTRNLKRNRVLSDTDEETETDDEVGAATALTVIGNKPITTAIKKEKKKLLRELTERVHEKKQPVKQPSTTRPPIPKPIVAKPSATVNHAPPRKETIEKLKEKLMGVIINHHQAYDVGTELIKVLHGCSLEKLRWFMTKVTPILNKVLADPDNKILLLPAMSHALMEIKS